MASTTLADVGAFIRFHLDSERGKDLRRKRQILIGRSLQTCSNNLRILHRREMLAKIDLKISQMAQIETTLSTTEKYFRLGEQRILAVVFLLLLAPAGSRPDSILKIRLGNLRLSPKIIPACEEGARGETTTAHHLHPSRIRKDLPWPEGCVRVRSHVLVCRPFPLNTD